MELSAQDYEIHGLEHFLSHLPSDSEAGTKRSLLLWNLLIRLTEHWPASSRHDFFKGIFRWRYYSERSALFDARFLKRLREHPWLPGTNGSLVKPSQLALDDLPAPFERNQTLIGQLKLQPANVSEIARQLGVDPEDVAFIRNHKQEFAEFKQAVEEKRRREEALRRSEAANGDVDYEEALNEVFARPNSHAVEETLASPGVVSNPVLRRQRLADEVKAAIDSEPDSQSRFAKVPRRIWEAKENMTRAFLKEQYAGKCQICRETFFKRDGEPYFEGLYLVSRTVKKWLDRPGNVLCLCPTCCAKFLYGSVEADNIVPQALGFRAKAEGGTAPAILELTLCGTPVKIGYTEKHMLELQELIKASHTENKVEVGN